MPTSQATRKYWVSTLLGWAEARLMPPQYEECAQVLQELLEAAGLVADCQAELVCIVCGNPISPAEDAINGRRCSGCAADDIAELHDDDPDPDFDTERWEDWNEDEDWEDEDWED